MKEFVDFVVLALEQQRKKRALEQISHEFKSPIVGIRGTASLLQRRIDELDDELVQRKLNDMLAGCELLLVRVKDFEEELRGSSRPSKIEETSVDTVITNAINLLEPVAAKRRFDWSKLEYEADKIRMIPPIYVPQGALLQVVYNLLENSIKYAKDDPSTFRIVFGLPKSKKRR